MSQATPQPSDCCSSACTEPTTVNTPGLTGATGAAGENGNNGTNAYTITTAGFTMPASGGNVTVSVANSTWMVPGEPIFVQNAGSFTVSSKPTTTSVILTNLGYVENAAPATIIPNTQYVGPTGRRGTDGDSVDALNDISPTTTKGDLLVDNGANAPNSSVVRIGVGADGTVLQADSATAEGVKWAAMTTDAVSRSGDTMTGLLILSGDPVAALGAATKQYVDGVAIAGAPDASTTVKGITKLSVAPVSATDPIACGDNDPRLTASVLKIGDTMTGNLVVQATIQAYRQIIDQETVTYAATTDIDFNGKGYQTISLTGNLTLTTSNRGAGKSVSVRLIGDGSIRTLTFPAGWVFVGSAAPASLAANKVAILNLTGFGGADTDVIAAYAAQV